MSLYSSKIRSLYDNEDFITNKNRFLIKEKLEDFTLDSNFIAEFYKIFSDLVTHDKYFTLDSHNVCFNV